MPEQEGRYMGVPARWRCDGKCGKAWGRSSRPWGDASNPEGFEWLADDELPEAPENPGTYEGRDGKVPLSMNKWCVRECERIAWGSEPLPDWSKRQAP